MIIRLLTLGDQLVFSLSSFMLTIILARFFSETEFASYGIGMSIALTIQGVQRNCYIVQNAVLLPQIIRGRADKVLGEQAVAWLLLLGVEIFFAVALFIISDNGYYHAIAVSTIVCSLITTQLEFDRIMFIKHEKYFYPLIASLALLILNCILFFAVPALKITYFGTMGIIAAYTGLKMLWLFSAIGKPDLMWGWRLLLRDLRRYFAGSILGTIGYAGHNHVPLFILGAVSPPLQAAVFVAMRGLLQPLNIVVRSMDIIDKNFFQEHAKGSKGGVRMVLLRQMAMYLGLSAIVGVGVLLFGEKVVYIVYGEKYAAYSGILLGCVLIFSMLAVTFPLETVIVKSGKLNTYNYFRISAGIVGAALAFILCPSMGALGAIIASLGGWVVSIICALWLVWPILKKNKNPDNDIPNKKAVKAVKNNEQSNKEIIKK